MSGQEFTLVIDRQISDEEVDALFDAGCDDAMPVIGSGRTLLHFVREGTSLALTLVSAVRDVEAAGLVVAGVDSDDTVSLTEIAARTGRTHESVRLLSQGKRGPAGFPAPLTRPDERLTLWSWTAVRPWFAAHYPASLGDGDRFEYDRLIAAADLLVRARALTRGDEQATGLSGLVA